MKKILNNLLIGIAFTLIASSCEKENLSTINPFTDIANFGKGAYITLNSTVNLNLNYAAISTSKVSVKVDAYNNGVTIKEVKLFVVQSSNADPKTWKLIKAVPISGTTELSVTGAEIATALGKTTAALFAPGQFYTIYNQVVTSDNKTYDVSNTLQALEASSNYNSCFRWTAYVVCPFTGGMTGKYKVKQDDWADWSVGDIVDVTDGPGANQINLSKVWPNPAYGDLKSPLVISIDPATGTAKLATNNVVFADYGQLTSAYMPSSGTVGYVFSCTGYIGLKIGLKYGSADYGINALVLQKL